MTFRNIPRAQMPTVDIFFERFIQKRQPVVITNLFQGEAIRDITSRREAIDAFGSTVVHIQPQYAPNIAGMRDQLDMTIEEYLGLIEKDPKTNLVCTEHELPSRLMTLFSTPGCFLTPTPETEIHGIPNKWGDHDLLLNAFIANAGNCAHLHYDGDHREVVLYQVFGEKEVILFPPEKSNELRAFEKAIPFSGLYLENMNDAEIDYTVEQFNGYRTTLLPGEAVYIPSLMWHYLHYNSTGMSFNIRFGRNATNRFLSTDNFHRDRYVQAFASRMSNPTEVSRLEEPLEAIKREYLLEAGMADKVVAVRTLFQNLCREYLPSMSMPPWYGDAERERAEIEMIIRDIGQTSRYASPASLQMMRPAGQISDIQKRHIEDGGRRAGLSGSTLRQIMQNRIGKGSLDLLNKAEAAQMLAYLRSSSATW